MAEYELSEGKKQTLYKKITTGVILCVLSSGERRHSGKTSSFRAGMKAEPHTVINQKRIQQ
jgi:hypothetical protein